MHPFNSSPSFNLAGASLPGLLLAVALVAPWAAPAQAQAPVQSQSQLVTPKACPATLLHEFARLQDDVPQSLCQYAGKVILVVLGFPSNDFGKQEAGGAS